MAYKTDKLKARIIEKFGDQKSFAEAMQMSEATLSRYLATGQDWRGSMMMKAIDLLEIPSTQVDSYFFEPAVSKRKPKGARI